MRRKRNWAVAALVFCAIGTSSGCAMSALGDAAAGSSPIPREAHASVALEGSMIKQYLSAKAIASDATNLIVGTVIDSRTVVISNLPFTRYEIDVESVIAGDFRGDVAVVYMVGEPGWQVNLDVPDYLRADAVYAIFLQPTELPADSVGGDGYYIVGPAAWEQDSSGGFEIRTSVDDVGMIPEMFELAEIADVLKAGDIGSSR